MHGKMAVFTHSGLFVFIAKKPLNATEYLNTLCYI